MTTVWPITVTLPAPDWIDGLVVPDPPVVINQFASKQESRLLLSSVPAEAEFTVYYNPILYPALTALLNFYRTVGTFEDFTLPTSPNFFALGCPFDRETMYRAASPTGRWRFKQRPQLVEIELRQQQAICQLVSVVI